MCSQEQILAKGMPWGFNEGYGSSQRLDRASRMWFMRERLFMEPRDKALSQGLTEGRPHTGDNHGIPLALWFFFFFGDNLRSDELQSLVAVVATRYKALRLNHLELCRRIEFVKIEGRDIEFKHKISQSDVEMDRGGRDSMIISLTRLHPAADPGSSVSA